MDKKIGLAAFFHNFDESKDVELMFEDYIEQSSFRQYPIDVIKRRNILIYLTLFQILASLIGMLYVVIRRSFIYVFINIITLILAMCGIHGSVCVNAKTLIIHCIFTVSITSGFFMYQLLDLFLVNDTRYGDKRRINDNIIMLIFSIPYVYDMFTGIYNYLFIKSLSANRVNERQPLQEQIEEVKNKYTDEQINIHINNIDRRLCIICMDRERNTVMNPCGHMLCCEQCSNEIFHSNPKCPICKKKLSNYTRIIIS